MEHLQDLTAELLEFMAVHVRALMVVTVAPAQAHMVVSVAPVQAHMVVSVAPVQAHIVITVVPVQALIMVPVETNMVELITITAIKVVTHANLNMVVPHMASAIAMVHNKGTVIDFKIICN